MHKTIVVLSYAISLFFVYNGHGMLNQQSLSYHSRQDSFFNPYLQSLIGKSESIPLQKIRASSPKTIEKLSISTIEYMCVCPNPYEFLAVHRGLSEKFEEIHTPIKKSLLEKMYSQEDLDNWNADKYMLSTQNRLSPICFFNVNHQILCLAWCGKRSEGVAKFSEKLFVFKNLKHIFIFGICGCPSRDVEVGSIFMSKKYVNVQHITIGDYSSAISRQKIVYLFNNDVYFTPPQFFSYSTEAPFLDIFGEQMKHSGFNIKPATNFSFESFIDDPTLAHQINFRGEEEGATSIVDLEGAKLAAFNYKRCTLHSLRVVSDHTGLKIGEIIEGKTYALDILTKTASPAMLIWMEPSLEKNKIEREERTLPEFPESSPKQLPIVFFSSNGKSFLRSIFIGSQNEQVPFFTSRTASQIPTSTFLDPRLTLKHPLPPKS